MLAHENAKADGKEHDWIARLYLDAIASADAATRKEARALVPELGGTFAAAAPATGIDRPADAAGDAGEGGAHPAATMEMPVGFAKGAEAPKP